MRLGAYRLLGEIPLSFNYLKVNKNIKYLGCQEFPVSSFLQCHLTPHLALTPIPWSSHRMLLSSNMIWNDQNYRYKER